jgi:hypothetical protein
MDKDINQLKKDYAVMKNEMQNMSKTVNGVDNKLDSYIMEDREWKKELSKELEAKFAGKWVEKMLVYIIGGTAVSVLVWLITYK